MNKRFLVALACCYLSVLIACGGGVDPSGTSSPNPATSTVSSSPEAPDTEPAHVTKFASAYRSHEGMPPLSPSLASIGDIGRLTVEGIKVRQVVGPQDMIVTADGKDFWLTGIGTSRVVDDAVLSTSGWIFEITGTRRYGTAIGATRQIYELMAYNESEFEPLLSELRREIDVKQTEAVRRKHEQFIERTADTALPQPATQLRTFTAKNGEYKTQAAFVEFRMDKERGSRVILRKEDGTEVDVAMNDLSKDDHMWIRDEVKRRRGK